MNSLTRLARAPHVPEVLSVDALQCNKLLQLHLPIFCCIHVFAHPADLDELPVDLKNAAEAIDQSNRASCKSTSLTAIWGAARHTQAAETASVLAGPPQ